MELGTEKEIRSKIDSTLREIRSTTDKDRLMLLSNYIGNLYSALSVIKGEKRYPITRKMLGNKANYRYFEKKTDELFYDFDDNFIINKDFHFDIFYEILLNIKSVYFNMLNSNREYCGEVDSMSEEEFVTIFFDFCKSIGVEHLFKELLDNNGIYKMKSGTGVDNYKGLALFHPFTGDSSVVIKDFSFSISSMKTLAHEMGHIYDLKQLLSEGREGEITDYSYRSLFGEVMSRLFERLFLEYLITHNIYRNIALDELVDFEITNYDYFNRLILSLLRDNDLVNENYSELSDTEIINQVRDYFPSEDILREHLEYANLYLSEDVSYAYGDIISMKLREYFKEGGFDNPKFRQFMKHRTKIFKPNYIRY